MNENTKPLRKSGDRLSRQNEGERGFTVLEIIVVFFIIGILAAIALPSLLTCGNKGKQSEARQNLGALNRAQQAYFLEKGKFSNSFVELGVGIQTETDNYTYSMQTTAKYAFHYATAKASTRKSYVGGVWWQPEMVGGKLDKITTAILCEADSPGANKAANPIYKDGQLVCALGTKPLQ